MGFFLPLDVKLEIGPPLSNLGGWAICTLGGGTGTSGGIMIGPEGGMWTLCWKLVKPFTSPSAMTLGCTEGIYLVHPGCSFWFIMAAFWSGFYCGGSAVLFTLSAALVNILESCSIATISESPMMEMALEVLGYSRHRLIHVSWWWHFLRNNCRGVEYYVEKSTQSKSRSPLDLVTYTWWHR